MKIYTTAQVASRYGVHTATVIGWCNRKVIKAFKQLDRWIIPVEALDGFTPPVKGWREGLAAIERKRKERKDNG